VAEAAGQDDDQADVVVPGGAGGVVRDIQRGRALEHEPAARMDADVRLHGAGVRIRVSAGIDAAVGLAGPERARRDDRGDAGAVRGEGRVGALRVFAVEAGMAGLCVERAVLRGGAGGAVVCAAGNGAGDAMYPAAMSGVRVRDARAGAGRGVSGVWARRPTLER
jgi:hypothetical protein